MVLIINHKSHLSFNEIKDYEKKLRKFDLIVLPSDCYLSLFQKGKYKLGAQDISIFKEKNRTGEITGEQLNSLNVKYCLVGHSDRRIYNSENDTVLKQKLERCYENNIIPLYCIGETSDETYKEEISKQLELIKNNFSEKEIILVYEPKKNIGNSHADFSNIEKIIKYIKENTINNKYKLIYGGGIRTNNLDYIKKIKELDGIIIYTEGIQINDFKKIYSKAKE